MIRVTLAMSLVLLVAGCSDDGETTGDTAVTDQSVGQEGGATPDVAVGGDTAATDQGPGQEGGPTPDAASGDAVAGDHGPLSDQGGTNKPNSGTICTPPQNVCPSKQDECIIVAGGNQNLGMCLIKCTTKYDPCPTADPATQKSVCFLEYTGPPAELYCAYMCKYENQTYTCPTGSTCKSISTNTSVCVQQ